MRGAALGLRLFRRETRVAGLGLTETIEPGDESRPRCTTHGLRYDPRVHTGCVLCRRDAAAARGLEPKGSAPGASDSMAGLLAHGRVLGVVALLLVVASVAFGIARAHSTSSPGQAAPIAQATSGQAQALPSAPSRSVASPRRAPAGPPLRVLFIGNSLTYTNDLPAMIVNLAAAANEPRRFEARLIAAGGFHLRDHVARSPVASALADAAWDAVVLQEQGQIPSFPPADREAIFFVAARQLDASIRRAGAKTVFYETFGRQSGDGESQVYKHDNYAAMQARLNEGYAMIARELGAQTVRVGHVWQRALQERPTMQLWVADGMHPTPAGTYLAACTFYAHFYDRSPVGNSFIAGLDPADALAIQRLAADERPSSEPSVATAAAPSAAPDLRAPGPRGTDLDLGVVSARGMHAADAQATAASATAQLEAEQDRQRHEWLERERNERAERIARTRVPIVLYSTTWCPSCQAATAYLREHDFSFVEKDIEKDEDARSTQRRLNPSGSVPTIDVGGKVLVGWNAQRFENALDAAASRH